MSKNTETIKDRISAKEQEQREAINQSKAERAALAAKLADLKEKQKDPANLDEYKKTAQEIRDTEAYINFIDAKALKATTGIISNAEYNDMRAAILKEIEETQTAAAPELQKAFFELIDLMEKYTLDIIDLESLADRAQHLNNPKLNSFAKNRAGNIAEINPDKCGYWKAFVYMFYSMYPEAQRIKNADAHPWKK